MSYNINVKQGATFRLDIKIKDSNGTPINLTGHTFQGQIRKLTQDNTIQASFTFTIANQVTNPGEVRAELTATATAAIACEDSSRAQRRITEMSYDIESTDTNGVVNRWLEGVAYISPEVTR
jgi:uncharacterized protein YndB with AHSA1/START domain